MIKLHNSCEKFEYGMLPHFLDNEAKKFLISLADLEIDQSDKTLQYTESIKDNKIIKDVLVKPLIAEPTKSLLDMLRNPSSSRLGAFTFNRASTSSLTTKISSEEKRGKLDTSKRIEVLANSIRKIRNDIDYLKLNEVKRLSRIFTQMTMSQDNKRKISLIVAALFGEGNFKWELFKNCSLAKL